MQAVSKWECSLSYPDIELLPLLAQILGVSVDALLCGENSGSENMDGQMTDSLLNLPDDGCIRIVQFKGAVPLREDIYSPDVKIPLVIDFGGKNTDTGPVNIEIWGSAEIDGNVSGDASAGTDMTCGDVGGDASAGADMTCGDVGGDASAGADISCSEIAGNAESSGAISCQSVGRDVEGNINTELKISCNKIEGNASAKGEITVTGDISGDVTASDIACNAVDGDTIAVKITCDRIDSDVTSDGKDNDQ